MSKKNMKRLIIILVLIAAGNIFIAQTISNNKEKIEIASFDDTLKVFKPTANQAETERIIQTILTRYHYKKAKFDDSLSEVVFDRFLKTLDPNRNYLLASDVEDFKKARDEFDDDFKEGNLEHAYNMFNVFYRRFIERNNFGTSLLEKEMDFTKDEQYQVDREDAAWPKETQEANEIWRLKVKNDALGLKLTGKNWKEISESLKKRYDNLKKALTQYSDEDVFQLLMNSYTEAVDPHTNYLSPITSENFKINMSLSLEGIGAQLQQDDEYTKVAEIVVGGPAYKSNLIHKGDKIVAVAQGDTGEFVDVVGWRITEVVQLIRGPKGSAVRLHILEAEEGKTAEPKEIRLVRDKIKLEEQASKQKVLEIKDDKVYKIGVITVPAFYTDFEAQSKGEKDFKSTTADVKKLIGELQKEKVDGIVIDLRNNGGGALNEAISLTGLFIEDGPVVQVKNANGQIDVGEDPDPSQVYDGPLAVLVNKFSASASEIFAGAIQDYGRGIIIGDQTYGKGTVQNLIDLSRLMNTSGSDDKAGQIKLTIAKYYRIDGGSTQNKGVVPDIKFPSYFEDPKEFGESSEPSALPWDQIKPSDYHLYGNIKKFVPELEQKHEERLKKNNEFENLLEDIDEYKVEHDKKFVSLNEKVRKQEKDQLEEKRFQRENEMRKAKGLKLLKKGETPAVTDKQEVIDDALLQESANILKDYIQLTIG